jgi:hypothetical protein
LIVRTSAPFTSACLVALGACVLGVPACSGASPDFAVDAAAPHEMTGPEEASSPVPDATRPPDDATPSIDDGGGAVVDVRTAIEASSAVDSGGSSEAGDDGGTFALCARICMGCCDAAGKCRPGNTTTVCGAMGAACEDCSMHLCTTLTEAPCCGANGCGCGVAGILGCK